MELMDYMDAYRLLTRYGIKSVKSSYVENAREAVRFAAGNPVALKAISGRALHKSRSGLIMLNLGAESAIRDGFKKLEEKARRFKPYKILAQRMVVNGLEIIIGGRVDEQFGKLILIGLGGIYVETFKDFAMRVCPISKNDAKSMLEQLKSGSVIARDERMKETIGGLLLKTSRMLMENKINELDLNPIIIHDKTYDAVDIRILK